MLSGDDLTIVLFFVGTAVSLACGAMSSRWLEASCTYLGAFCHCRYLFRGRGSVASA